MCRFSNLSLKPMLRTPPNAVSMVLIKKVGRSKIPITWIKSDASRHVTFTKRKKGLKKKVEELAILCGVEACMICFGPQAGKSISTPYSWGLPSVSHVIEKYRSLGKEEQDKKKLDNTSLLEQQIKKLKSEIKIKREQNQNLVNERSLLLWNDHLCMCDFNELHHVAQMVLHRIEEVDQKITYYISQQQQDLLGLGNTIKQIRGNDSAGDDSILTTVPFNCEVRMPGPFQKLVAAVDSLSNFEEGSSSRVGAVTMSTGTQGSQNCLTDQISYINLPAFIEKHKAAMPIDNSANCTNGNVYHNMDAMLPLSKDMSYLSSPLLSLRVKKEEQLAEQSPTRLYNRLTEPHMLSNMTWQQAVGLEPDDHLQCSPASVHPNEYHEEGPWAIECINESGNASSANSKNAVEIEREAYDALGMQNTSIHLCHAHRTGTDEVSETQVNADAMQAVMLRLDVQQLAAFGSDPQEVAYQEAAEPNVLSEGTMMWNLEEETTKTSCVYQSHTLADEGMLSSLHDRDETDVANDVKMIDY